MFNFLLLLQTEFQKLRRKPVIWLMLLAAFVMPFFAAVYFRALGNLPVSPPAVLPMGSLWIYPVSSSALYPRTPLHHTGTR